MPEYAVLRLESVLHGKLYSVGKNERGAITEFHSLESFPEFNRRAVIMRTPVGNIATHARER